MSSPAPQLLQRLKGIFSNSDAASPNNTPVSSGDGSFAQAVPQVIQQATDTLNPAAPTSSAKESREPSVTLERPQIDMVGGLQQVEQEPNVEMSPEVESFIQEVAPLQDQLPQEIVIADAAAPVSTTPYLAKPVVVLPITHEVEKDGARKSTQMSIRWLVEWSRKMMKVFAGGIVYKEASSK